ncbi:MAG: GAF domain-containing protein, partial [Proteobacteria bacterium]|nr:GAF domain-containing protein [Pseudomonadota bacterium]
MMEAAARGKHARAIELASAALESADLPLTERIALLDLRAESLTAEGDLARALADAESMLGLAGPRADPALRAKALTRRAYLRMREGRPREATDDAAQALRAAQRSREPEAVARALLCLAEAQSRSGDRGDAALRTAGQARAQFDKLGNRGGEGRAMWVVAMVQSREGQPAQARAAASEALELCRGAGDRYGVGNALNLLMFDEPDVAERLRLLQPALAAFEVSGHVERRAMVTFNLAIAYDRLGLYRRARRLALSAGELYERAGARSEAAGVPPVLAGGEIELGHLDAARRHLEEHASLVAKLPEGTRELHLAWGAALRFRLAFDGGDWSRALVHARAALRHAEREGRPSMRMNCLAMVARAELETGKATAALATTRRATRIHSQYGFIALEGLDAADLWWHHSLALAANGKNAEAAEAVDRAYRFMCAEIAHMGDEGLRRNYLGKRRVNREIVAAWLADGARRRSGKGRKIPHLEGDTNVREPLQRVVDGGLRMNEIRSAAELREFIVDEITELTGAERVLLALEGPQGFELAGALVPPGEDASVVLERARPLFEQAGRIRSASLAWTPARATAVKQRSKLVAPLIARQEIVGYVYADLDGAYGRFRESDRDLVGLFASQAAVALDNTRFTEELEQKVAERTADLQVSNASLEQRANELAVVNGIQRGMAARLDFDAIVDLVGDKLREVFATGDLGIWWWESARGIVRSVYVYEHGKRLGNVEVPVSEDDGVGGRAPYRMLVGHEVLVAGNHAEQNACGFKAVPGTDRSQSVVGVPMIAGDRAIGAILVENHEREHAFGPAEVRLVTTIAAGMGVALENARLFDETQRLLKETEQRNAELAVINRIQQGIGAELDFQSIVDLVGDKLCEVFATGDMSIRWWDEPADRMRMLYAYEHGVRLPRPEVEPPPPPALRRFIAERKVSVFNTIAEQEAAGVNTRPGTDQARSIAAVPMLSGKRLLGMVILENHERDHAFGPSEVRLLETIAGSMGAALENARLFDETQRLLKETERRAAELAVINSVQQGLAAELEFQAIVDLVGDRIAGVLHTRDMSIALYDRSTDLLTIPYWLESGRRFPVEPTPLRGGFVGHVIRTGQPLAVNRDLYARARECGSVEIGDPSQRGTAQSYLGVPVMRGGVAHGVIAMYADREDAFSDGDVHLMTTLANAMSVALENARLLDETRRREREAAALAEVGRDLSSSRDLSSVMDRIARHAKELLTA